jgi:hypothetical protein
VIAGLLVARLLAVAVCAQEPAEAPLPPPPFEFQPYRVTCAVAVDPDDPDLLPLTDAVVRELPPWVARTVGGRWEFGIHAAGPADWARRSRLESGTWTGLPPEADIVFRVVIRREGNRLCADVRAFEPLFNHRSPVRTATCFDPRELPAAVAVELQQLFRPRAVWERQDDQTVRLRIQAGALSAGEDHAPIVTDGEVFAPWIVFRNRERQVQKAQELPWTYLVLGETDDGRGVGRVVSGLRHPLGARPRGRIDLVAVALRPQWTETTVQVLALSQPPRPLPAHRVELQPLVLEPDADAAPPPSTVLLTDREGRVRLSRETFPGLHWLRVTSGDLLLARVPVLAGASATARLELPDDSLRLNAEGQLKLLQGDLISVVAQRSALMATARAAAKKQDWEDAKLRLRQIDALPTPQSLKQRVSAVRVEAVTTARQRRDRLAEQRINRLCNETEEMIQHYLADDRVRQLKEELAELEAALKPD